MSNTIALLNRGGEWERYSTSPAVYRYIRQLEEYIKHPDESKLKEVYKERFGK